MRLSCLSVWFELHDPMLVIVPVCAVEYQDPGKVFKGKKMPGRMGFKTITTEGLQVGARVGGWSASAFVTVNSPCSR